MREQGIITDSCSPLNSPLFLVPQKDGSFRPVIDFRRLIVATQGEQFPLPVLSDFMDLGGGNKFFSSLDLVLSGYWQVPMDPESCKLTAFSTKDGYFEWLRMPFGLKTAPMTFQRMITKLLRDLKGKHIFAYLDDVIIASLEVDSHLASLEAVLNRLRRAGLKVKLSKCEFLKNWIRFLGHEVDSSGIHTQADKIQAVSNFLVPSTVDNVCSFLGLAQYYHDLICNFSKIASPLNQLLRKGSTFHWDAPQQKSFEELKHVLTTTPVLQFSNYEKPFTLYTDASLSGLGAVLMQPDSHGKLSAIAYASCSLNHAER